MQKDAVLFFLLSLSFVLFLPFVGIAISLDNLGTLFMCKAERAFGVQ